MRIEILAMGDWGAPPEMHDPDDVPRVRALQNQVAKAMVGYARDLAEKETPLTAVFGLGDNFYGRLTGPDDARWEDRFEELYSRDVLDVPFYFALGNHDYEDHKQENWKHEIAHAKQNPEGRWKWPAADGITWFRQDFPSPDPLLTAIFLDTSTDHVKGKWDGQIQFLQQQMAASQESQWRIVVAHHPMWTDGFHFDGAKDPDLYPKIRQTILPELGSAVFYVSAHDHNLQHIRHRDHPATDFLLAGAGGGDFTQKRRRDDAKDYTNEFFQSIGFVHLSFTPEEARAQLIAVDNNGFKPVGTGAVRKA